MCPSLWGIINSLRKVSYQPAFREGETALAQGLLPLRFHMPKRVVGAPAEFAAWAEFLGRATGSLKYPSAGPCFCSPDFYLDSCYLLYQAEINEKE